MNHHKGQPNPTTIKKRKQKKTIQVMQQIVHPIMGHQIPPLGHWPCLVHPGLHPPSNSGQICPLRSKQHAEQTEAVGGEESGHQHHHKWGLTPLHLPPSLHPCSVTAGMLIMRTVQSLERDGEQPKMLSPLGQKAHKCMITNCTFMENCVCLRVSSKGSSLSCTTHLDTWELKKWPRRWHSNMSYPKLHQSAVS